MIDYKRAGVNIDKGNKFVKDIAKMVASTSRSEVMGGIGGVSALSKIPGGKKKAVFFCFPSGGGAEI